MSGTLAKKSHNTLTDDKILALSKVKAFADDDVIVDQMAHTFMAFVNDNAITSAIQYFENHQSQRK